MVSSHCRRRTKGPQSTPAHDSEGMQPETAPTGPNHGKLGASQPLSPAAGRGDEPIPFSGVSQRQTIITAPRGMIIRFIKPDSSVARTVQAWDGYDDKEMKMRSELTRRWYYMRSWPRGA
jgi:hypothetical protein